MTVSRGRERQKARRVANRNEGLAPVVEEQSCTGAIDALRKIAAEMLIVSMRENRCI